MNGGSEKMVTLRLTTGAHQSPSELHEHFTIMWMLYCYLTLTSGYTSLRGEGWENCAQRWILWILLLLLATDDSSERVLLQQIFWSLGLSASPTWQSPPKANKKGEEKCFVLLSMVCLCPLLQYAMYFVL